MNIEEMREYCLSKADSFECFPFNDDVLVFKITLPNGKSKIFALCFLSKPNYLIVKCNPELAIELRERHVEIEPAFHMNKVHWNGIYINGTLPTRLIHELIDHSYKLVCGNKKSK